MQFSVSGAPYAKALADRVEAAVASVIQGRDAYALMDFPFHNNIGDSAIWLGEIQLLKRIYGCNPSYVSTATSPPDEAARFVKDEVIFLHGGGNFGDLWPGHQRYREAILTRHRHNRIICLPQSVHFRLPDALEASRRAFAAHPDLHMMARDHESFDLMQRHYDCNVMLVPDSAFAIDLGPVARTLAPQGIGCLFREDIERRDDAADASALFSDAVVADWPTPGRGYWRAIRFGLKLARRGPNLVGMHRLMALRSAFFNQVARANVMTGFQQLDQFTVVVTDRLHGHIMSILLDKPHVVIDNSYGKIARFIDAWPGDGLTSRATDYKQAREMADALMDRAATAGVVRAAA